MPAPQKRPLQGRCDALSLHMRAIGRVPLLRPEEEIQLGRRVQEGRRLRELAEELKLRAGGVAPTMEAWAVEAGLELPRLQRCLRRADRARDRMVLANLRLVVSMARVHRHAPVDQEDLIQEGTIGLIRAVERFDPSRGYRFSTYASWWIREGISNALVSRSRTIRLPATMVAQLHRLRQAQQSLAQRIGRDPGRDELAEATGHKPLDVREVLFRSQQPLSLDARQGHDSDYTLGDSLVCPVSLPQEQLESSLERQDLRRTLAELPEREAELLRLRYGLDSAEPLSLCAAARQMGISRDLARGLERRANAAIRRLSLSDLSNPPHA